MDSVVRRSPMPFSAGLNGGGGGGGREELWSEAETAALVDAWGERYVRLNRGSLRQGDWREVAIAVNETRAAAGRPPKSDIQCKNRVDTLKKKYKIEKSKLGRSLWPFFDDLDFLVGGGAAGESGKSSSLTLPPVTLGNLQSRPRQNPTPAFAPKRWNLNAGVVAHSSSWLRPPVGSSGSSESSRSEFDDGWGDHDGGEDKNEDGVLHSRDLGLRKNAFFGSVVGVKRPRNHDNFGGQDGGVGRGNDKSFPVFASGNCERKDGAFTELAGAIMKLADIYEKVEASKQQTMLQMERQRMEFTKDLEFQRMKMFMDAQLKMEKIKRPKNHSGTGKKL